MFFVFCFLFSYGQHYLLYGITWGGGVSNNYAGYGMIYRYDPMTNELDTLHSLNGTDGIHTYGNLTLASNGLLYGSTLIGGIKDSGVLFSFNPYNLQYNVLVSFDIKKGYYEYNSNTLMQAKDGLLYGTRELGGAYDSGGTLFSYNIITGKDSILHSFKGGYTDGIYPNCTVVEDTNTGYFYGTTLGGGANEVGVIYRFDPLTNKDTVIFSFDTLNEDAQLPKANTLLRANNGLYYGLTAHGGRLDGWGTIHRFNAATDQDTTLYRFATTDSGLGPQWNNLMQASNGLLYGMTTASTISPYDGVMFSYNILTNKVIDVIHFNGPNGNFGEGSLVQDPDNGLLYGITQNGGTYGWGILFSYNITTGQENVLVNFNDTNGAYPESGLTLVLDTGGLGVPQIHPAISGNTRVEPNPNNGVFTLTLPSPSGEGVSFVEIYNMLGEQVYDEMLKSVQHDYKIDLSSRPAGIYLYRVVTTSGKLIGDGKFVIER